MRLSSVMSDFRQCPWDLGSALAERAGQGDPEGGWVSALSLGSMAAFGLGLEKLLVGAGWAILSFFAQMGRENSPLA